jgi:imidazolonepropionase-like amidohydrolase
MPGMIAARAYPANAAVPWWGNTRTLYLADEESHPLLPECDPRYIIDPFMPNWKIMRELGLTTYLVTPGNLNLIGGKGVVLRGIGDSYDEMMRDPEPKAMVFSVSEGTRRRWGDDRFEGGGVLTLLRETLDRAKNYQTHLAQGRRVPRDLKSEALIPVLDGRLLAIFNAERESEIRSAIELGDEYGLRMAISSGVEAHKVIDELTKRDIPVILGNSGLGWSSFENIRGVAGLDFDEQMPAKLARAGIKVAMFGPGGHRGNLPIGRVGGEPVLNAAWCFKNGMSEADALKMVTLNAAEIAGMGDRLGSLEKGKIADIVIMSGHPLTHKALPEMVLIDGKIVFQRSRPRSKPTSSSAPDRLP